MKAERTYPRYTVTAKAEAAILRGHPWVYDEEITAPEGQAENGGLVDVISKKGRYLGTGFLSEPVSYTHLVHRSTRRAQFCPPRELYYHKRKSC